MAQQILALMIVIFFLIKIVWQYRHKEIQKNEFTFWLLFWFLAAIVIILLKQIDQVVANLGFSGSGIQVVFYLGVVLLFYLLGRLRLRLAKMDSNISKLVTKLAIEENNKLEDK
ncbi:MAG: DUF2304 domain-containing protein [bacterium]